MSCLYGRDFQSYMFSSMICFLQESCIEQLDELQLESCTKFAFLIVFVNCNC